MAGRAYTIDQLAERWDVSANHVRQMCREATDG